MSVVRQRPANYNRGMLFLKHPLSHIRPATDEMGAQCLGIQLRQSVPGGIYIRRTGAPRRGSLRSEIVKILSQPSSGATYKDGVLDWTLDLFDTS
jgi:hypothetical protein